MRIVLLVIIGYLVTGCAVPSINKHVDQLIPYHIKNKSKTIAVSKITDEVAPGKVIGTRRGGLACISNGHFWQSNTGMGDYASRYEDILKKRLEENGHSIVGNAFLPFKDEYTRQAELLLGGRIVDIAANLCIDMVSSHCLINERAKGEAYLKIAWEVYDTKSKAIVFETISEGYSKASDFIENGVDELLRQAFIMAADNLLADEKFYKLLALD